MKYFLLGVLLSVKGASAAPAQSEKVWALAGEDVILPCRLKTSSSDDLQTLEWSKKDLHPNVVFLYRDGCETPEMKNEDFEFRTSLFMKELNNGNASLRISNLKPSDAGTYGCLRILKDETREETVVELDVGPVSPVVDLKLALVSAGTGGVTVECQARCWSPELEMKVLDGEGNNVPGKQREELESGGCVAATQRATLQNPTSRVVCRVYQPMTNQSITAEILPPVSGSGMSSIFIIVISVLSTSTICLVPVLVIIWFRKGYFKSGRRELPDQSTTGASDHLRSPMLTTETENKLNVSIESLRKEVASLQSQNAAKDEIIHQKQSSSLPCGVMCDLKQPTILPSPSKSSLESLTTPNPTPDLNAENRKLLPKPDKASKKTDPNPNKASKKTDSNPDKASKKTDPNPDKAFKKTVSNADKDKKTHPKAEKGKKIDPKANKAKKNNHPAPSLPLQKNCCNSSPAQLTLSSPELISPVCNKKKDHVVQIHSQRDPVHQFDPNAVYQHRSFSAPSSSSSYYNRYSSLEED